MNSSATRSCRWRRSSERATPSRAWTLPPSTMCGSSWTTSAAQGCRSTRSSATHHLPHSILRIWRSESTIHTMRGEGVGLAWEHKPMPSFHQTTACISLFFECSSRGSILQKLHHTDGTRKPVAHTSRLWLADGAYVGRDAESGKPTAAPQHIVQSCDVEGGPTWVRGPMGFARDE